MKTGLIIGIYFALVCCREKIQPAVVQADLSEAVYTDTTWFADCEIIFPETTDRSLISMINKIVLTPERIFLFDIQDKKILLFTRRGKFITDIRPHGRGPGEWLGITDFTVDETDREIIVTADRPYKFLYYDYNGNFLREKTSEAFYTEITRTTDNILAINSKILEPKHYLSLLNEEDHRITVAKKIPLAFTYRGEFRCRGSYLLKSEHLYFTQNGDYTIYSWDNNRIKPVVTVDFGKYSYNPTQLNEEPHAPATRNKVLSIINVKEIRSNLFFNTNKIGLFVYNKTRHQIVHAYGITNINLGIVLHNSIATEDTHNEIVAFSYDMPILQRKLAGIASDNPVIKQIQNAKEDDNPLLFLYKSI